MSVLVLVLSCDRPPYCELYEAQRRTWDSVHVPDVETSYYFCDDLPTQHLYLAKALEAALLRPWRHLFRTNSSSYVDKARLLAWADTMLAWRCYAGVDGGGFASGSGMLLSRDICEILVTELPKIRPSDIIEDQHIGSVLAAAGHSVTPGARRYDFWLRAHLRSFCGGAMLPPDDAEELRESYHCRCKFEGDRAKDVEAMEEIHRLKMMP